MGMAKAEERGMPTDGSKVKWKSKWGKRVVMQRESTSVLNIRPIAWMCLRGMAGICWSGPAQGQPGQACLGRIRVLHEDGWRFDRGDVPGAAGLQYDLRPALKENEKDKAPDAMAAVTKKGGNLAAPVLEPWMFPSDHSFLQRAAKQYRLAQILPPTSSSAETECDDQAWKHDWSIAGSTGAADKNNRADTETFPADERNAFQGLVPAAVRSKRNQAGTVVAEGVQAAEIWINDKP